MVTLLDYLKPSTVLFSLETKRCIKVNTVNCDVCQT